LAENVYEGMFILDSGQYGREPDVVSGKIRKMIEDAGGQVLVSRLWEERRLAYAIRGHRKGTYWLTYSRLDGGRLADIRRQCQLIGSILRVLFVKVDPRIVDTLVEHAQAGVVKAVGERADRHSSTEPKKEAGKQAKEPEAVVAGEGKPQPPPAEDAKA
jgi:small subunit ribosomal protein S6